MKEEIRPGDIVVPDQFIDRTKARAVDASSATAWSATSASAIRSAATWPAHVYDRGQARRRARAPGGTYVVMEGPQFSTRAESNVYRSWGVDVIGMTNLQEAKLAREAEICYSTIALSTDYDCWHETEEDVTRRGGDGDHQAERRSGEDRS